MTASAPITLDPSQLAAVELVCAARVGVVTGGPGTGKSTCLGAALDRMDGRGERYVLASPTGKAARRMREVTGRKASTVHRLLGWSGEGFDRNRHNPIEAGCVIIDESSMLDVRLMDALTEAIDPAHTRLILVGDADQLPSVGPGRVFADIIAAGTVPVARLTTLHRAAAETWVCSQAPVILGGSVPDLEPRADFIWREERDRARALEGLLEVVFRTLPGRGAKPSDIQVLIPMKVGPCGCRAANLRLQALLNPSKDSDPAPWKIGTGEDVRTLALRDRVIQTRNDYDLEVANGEVGEVAAIHAEPTECPACAGTSEGPGGDACVRCSGKGKRPPCLVVRYPDDTGDRLVAYAKGEAYALDLAYALTIHKSQGSQWPWVVVMCHSTHTIMLTRQLLYTGITRAQRGVVLVGDLPGLSRAVKNTSDARRNTWLAQELRGTEEPGEAQELLEQPQELLEQQPQELLEQPQEPSGRRAESFPDPSELAEMGELFEF